MHQIIALWCHPRSLSTVFERMMRERGDLRVLHEKFLYLYYVRQNPHLIIAKQQEIEPYMMRDFPEVLDDILKEAEQGPVFFKDMAVHIHNPKGYHADAEFLSLFTNTFLIRDPEPTIQSHLKQNPTLELEEVGYHAQLEVFSRVRELTGETPVVIDAYDLEDDPEGMIRAYCEAVGIPFIREALEWEAVVPPEFEVGASTWHADVVKTTGFQRRMERFDPALKRDPRFREYYEACLPCYQAMYDHRLRSA